MLNLDQIDAFTSSPFQGNAAAVVLADHGEHGLEPAKMQAVAAEMNLSETAFVDPPDADGARPIRYFTPTVEVALCGHATLASAHSLWERGIVPDDQPIDFRTIEDATLTCTRAADGRIAMALPIDRPTPAEPPAGQLDALRLPAPPLQILRGRFGDWVYVLPDAASVAAVSPDFGALTRFERGHFVTAPTPGNEPLASEAGPEQSEGPDAPAHFVSRCFFPSSGIPENPVTGSAHCTLGPYWSDRLGNPDLRARQASARGGDLWVTVETNTVTVAGHAVTVSLGHLLL